MRKPTLTSSVLLVLALAGCRDRAELPSPASEAVVPAAETTTATHPPAAPLPEGAGSGDGMLPAPGTITFEGFGPAAFGATEEDVRRSWGKDMAGAPGEAGGCYLLVPAPRGEAESPLRFAFMLEGDKFVRIDVRIDAIPAPGGGRVGMPAEDIERLYPGAQAMPHKYVEGARTLRAKGPAGGAGTLVFETDAKGVVAAWRIGVPPQVDYVETCG
jgi:hypothetical protein